MSMSRIDQSLGRGSCSSCRARRKPVKVTGTVTSQRSTPLARSNGVKPKARAISPASAMIKPAYPTRSDHTAILQRPLRSNSVRRSMRESYDAQRKSGMRIEKECPLSTAPVSRNDP